MNYWHQVQSTSGQGPFLIPIVVVFFLFALFLTGYDPSSRRRIRASILVYILGIGGLLFAGAMVDRGIDPSDPRFRWIRAAALFAQSIAIITVLGLFIFDVALQSIRLRPPPILSDLILAAAYIVAAILLLSHTGVDIGGIITASAVVTAVIGFSLQDTLGNVMGGMALQLERTIGAGDWIQIDDIVGVVREIRWRQTSIETRNWDTVVIPNSVLMKNTVHVLGRRHGQPRQHRQAVPFNVDFRYPAGSVVDAVETALRDDPVAHAAREPAPTCLLSNFEDSYAKYVVYYWLTDLHKSYVTDSLVRTRIWHALQRQGIPLSMPANRTFQVNDDEPRKQRQHGERHAARLDALKTVSVLTPLNDEERQLTAERLRLCPFARGESMTHQGAEANWLYIITRGQAVVRVAVQGHDATQSVATLGAGDVFGEMGLMTGERRNATVVALTDVECYRLDKEGFHDILARRPQIAEDISELLARRRVELDAVRENLSEEARRQRIARAKGDLLGKIRRFFGLEGEG
jgi:small-conductance mechanosensitive channel/CRP-like cAMP-binding protein